MSARTKAWLTIALAVCLALVWAWQQGVFEQADPRSADQRDPSPAVVRSVAEADLPAQAREMLKRIDNGGPYRYREDGAIFENREGRLPKHPRGYYHEFTVDTPGSSDRGARRIITGRSGEYYWTQDHYRSFAKIRRQ